MKKIFLVIFVFLISFGFVESGCFFINGKNECTDNKEIKNQEDLGKLNFQRDQESDNKELNLIRNIINSDNNNSPRRFDPLSIKSSGFYTSPIYKDINYSLGETNCKEDGDKTGGTPGIGKSGHDSIAINVGENLPSSGTVNCKAYDKSPPNVVSFKHHEGWTNESATIEVTISEAGGSGIKEVKLLGTNLVESDSIHSLINGRSKTYIFTYWGGNGKWFNPCVNVVDYAMNSTTKCSNKFIYFDDQPIYPDDIDREEDLIKRDNPEGKVVGGEFFFRANKNARIYIKIKRPRGSTKGAPIREIVGSFDGIPVKFPGNLKLSAECGGNEITLYDGDMVCFYLDVDISKVTNHHKYNNHNYTTYDLIIKEIIDLAGNISDPNKIIPYYVYANYIDNTNSNIDKPILPGVADGQEKKYTFTLRDKYGNHIVPVKTTSGGQVRDLTFDTNYSNNLYLNQYNNSGGSGIFVSRGNNFYADLGAGTFVELPIPDSLKSLKINTIFSDPVFKNGIYHLGFKPYSPTFLAGVTDGRQYVDGNVKLTTDTTVKLSDKANNDKLVDSNQDLQFKPMFYTNFTGNLIDNRGLIVGARQDSNLELKDNIVSGSKNLNGNIYLEYGKIDGSDEKLKHKLDSNFDLLFLGSVWNNIAEGYKTNYTDLTSFGNIGKEIKTILLQIGELAKAENKTYFATHIKNIIDGKTSVYSSQVLGMDKYTGTFQIKDNTFQRPLKILGNTHSLYYSETVSGDSKNSTGNKTNITLLGNIEKAEMQKNVRKNVVDNIKNLKFTPANKTGNTTDLNIRNFISSSGVKIGDTLYFEKDNSENVEISGNYSGIKNIVIYGGNAYITGNITANNKNNDILSIISIEKNGKGGEIFIKNTVTRIDSVLYADKSLISTDNGTRKLSPKNEGTYEKLKNQLHIYGSVFTNNTIGGSINSSGMICPYYIPKSSCTPDEAQKYDLYNFRRGYENILTDPKDTSSSLKTGYSGDIKYPLIIEYNPLIQSKKLEFFQVTK